MLRTAWAVCLVGAGSASLRLQYIPSLIYARLHDLELLTRQPLKVAPTGNGSLVPWITCLTCLAEQEVLDLVLLSVGESVASDIAGVP